MKLSVALTTYNLERYLPSCLESIVGQDTDFSFEIVAFDDGSSDATPVMLQEYQRRFPELFVLELRDRNVGYAQNLSDVLRRCTGDYIAIFDGDDVMLPGKLSKQVRVLDDNPDVVLVGHLCRAFDSATGRTLRWVRPKEVRDRYSVQDHLHDGSFLANSSKMFRSDALPMHDLDPTLQIGPDWLLTFDIALSGATGYLHEHLSDYRVHAGSLMKKESLWKHQRDAARIADIVEQRFPGEFRSGVAHRRAYADLLRGMASRNDGDLAGAKQAFRTAFRTYPFYGLPLWRRMVWAELRSPFGAGSG